MKDSGGDQARATCLGEADRKNYESEINLARRQALLRCAVAPSEPQPMVWNLFDWGPSARVLDLGCGNGWWAKLASDRTPDGVVIGLDLSAGMLDALALTAPAVPGVRADGQQVPFASGSFDVVLAMWCPYHMPDKPAVLGEMRGVLRDGGLVIACTNEALGSAFVDQLMANAVDSVRTIGDRGAPWMEPIDFTLENGAAVLARYFADVRRSVNTTPYEVHDAQVLHDYALSLEDPVRGWTGIDEPDFARVVEHVDAQLADALASGPIKFVRRVAFFTARK